MVEGRQRVCLATAELGNEGEHWRSVFGLAGKASQYHTSVLAQRPGKACAREEFGWLPVVFGRSASHNLFEGNGKLVWIKGAALTNLLARERDLVPGLHHFPPLCSLG
jgi:hypothetical protein